MKRSSQVQREERGWKRLQARGQGQGRAQGGLHLELGRWRGGGGAEVPWGGVGCARACELVRTGLGD